MIRFIMLTLLTTLTAAAPALAAPPDRILGSASTSLGRRIG